MKIFNQKQLAMTLTVLGAVPLVFGAVCVFAGLSPDFLPAEPVLMLHAYAVVIASFVAGMHWGIHFCKRTNDSVYLISSLVALLLWSSFWFAGKPAGLAMVMAGFLLLWVEEYRLSKQRVTTVWFWQLRNIVSAVVVCALLLAIIGDLQVTDVGR